MDSHRGRNERRGFRALAATALSAVVASALLFGAHSAFGGTSPKSESHAVPIAVVVAAVAPHPRNPAIIPVPIPVTVPVPVKKPVVIPKFTKTLTLGAHGLLISSIQQRLNWTGIGLKVTGTFDKATAAAVKRFQTKQRYYANGRVDRTTYGRLVAVTKRGAGLDLRCNVSGAVLCIDKSQKVLRYLVDGKLLMLVDVRFGPPNLPTREGVFSVYYKSRQHVSTLFHTSMPYAMFFSGGQAVHYSKYFAAVGYNGYSHGCVNVRDFAAIAKLFGLVTTGTRVVVYHTV